MTLAQTPLLTQVLLSLPSSFFAGTYIKRLGKGGGQLDTQPSREKRNVEILASPYSLLRSDWPSLPWPTPVMAFQDRKQDSGLAHLSAAFAQDLCFPSCENPLFPSDTSRTPPRCFPAVCGYEWSFSSLTLYMDQSASNRSNSPRDLVIYLPLWLAMS